MFSKCREWVGPSPLRQALFWGPDQHQQPRSASWQGLALAWTQLFGRSPPRDRHSFSERLSWRPLLGNVHAVHGPHVHAVSRRVHDAPFWCPSDASRRKVKRHGPSSRREHMSRCGKLGCLAISLNWTVMVGPCLRQERAAARGGNRAFLVALFPFRPSSQ